MYELWWSKNTADADGDSIKIMFDASGANPVKCTHFKLKDGRKPEPDAFLVDEVAKITKLSDVWGVTAAGQTFAEEKGVAPTQEGLLALVDETRYARPSAAAPMTDAQKRKALGGTSL